MQNLLLMFLLLLVNTSMTKTSTKNTLNVFAPSGLNMRTTPSLKAKKLVKIPYGASVDVLENTKEYPLKVQEFKDFWIKGHWVKVQYKEHIGYVFDGYLSDLPAPKRQQYNPNKSSEMPDLAYLKSLGKVGKQHSLKYYEDATEKSSKELCDWSQDYNYGITYSKDICDEIDVNTRIILKNTTLSEAYLLVYLWFYNKEYYKWRFNIKDGYFGTGPIMELDDIGCQTFSISMKDKTTAVIEYIWGC